MGFYETFMNPKVRWVTFFCVMILNFVAYYQDPLRYSLSKKCIGIPCKWFDYIAGMGTFTMDVLTLLGLWYTIPFSDSMTNIWFIPIIIFGYAIISEITIWSDIYKEKCEVSSKTNETVCDFDPPPSGLWSRKKRLILYSIILILDIIIFAQFYIYAGNINLAHKTILHKFFLERFGGFYEGNMIQFFVSWVGILGILFDIIAWKIVYGFQACQYSLPKSWNF
tara:strand:- start:1112 stop:1780 length:669 start_codon:yes stop_codon:yes gene_type:complete